MKNIYLAISLSLALTGCTINVTQNNEPDLTSSPSYDNTANYEKPLVQLDVAQSHNPVITHCYMPDIMKYSSIKVYEQVRDRHLAVCKQLRMTGQL